MNVENKFSKTHSVTPKEKAIEYLEKELCIKREGNEQWFDMEIEAIDIALKEQTKQLNDIKKKQVKRLIKEIKKGIHFRRVHFGNVASDYIKTSMLIIIIEECFGDVFKK